VFKLNNNFFYNHFANMPKGVGALFFIQSFSTLAFSVLYSTLVLYVTHALHFSDVMATSITASFVAFNYALHLLGGYIGGRYLSYRGLFVLGMICQIIGCLLISNANVSALYWGLAFFLSGAGLNVTCINCMLTQLFNRTDAKREAAFMWNYSGMNIGFLVGFSLSGYFQLHHAYQQLFIISSVGNILALLLIFFQWQAVADKDTVFSAKSKNNFKKVNLMGVSFIVFLIFALHILLKHSALSNHLIMVAGILMAIVIAFLAHRQPKITDQNRIWAFLILSFMALVFWTLYQLVPMGLTLFIERNVDRHYWGMIIAPQWVQNINTIIIILGGPILSTVFRTLRDRGVGLTIPLQFSIALLLIGASVLVLPLGIYFSNSLGYTNFNWIIISYVLQSLGELFISPIGYAMVGQLAPQHLQGQLMGTWLMITGVAATLSNYFSTMALGNSNSINPLITNASFSKTFLILGGTSIVTGIILFYLKPGLTRLIEERQRAGSAGGADSEVRVVR
jgi:POT family proton-dependent oligopeptide transporter